MIAIRALMIEDLEAGLKRLTKYNPGAEKLLDSYYEIEKARIQNNTNIGQGAETARINELSLRAFEIVDGILEGLGAIKPDEKPGPEMLKHIRGLLYEGDLAAAVALLPDNQLDAIIQKKRYHDLSKLLQSGVITSEEWWISSLQVFKAVRLLLDQWADVKPTYVVVPEMLNRVKNLIAEAQFDEAIEILMSQHPEAASVKIKWNLFKRLEPTQSFELDFIQRLRNQIAHSILELCQLIASESAPVQEPTADMPIPALVDAVRELISKAETEAAISLLQQHVKTEQYLVELSRLADRHKRLKVLEIQGVMAWEERSIERNKINYELLELTSKIASSAPADLTIAENARQQADTFRSQNNWPKAREQYQIALNAYQKANIQQDPMLAYTLRYLALSILKDPQPDFLEAEKYLVESQKMYADLKQTADQGYTMLDQMRLKVKTNEWSFARTLGETAHSLMKIANDPFGQADADTELAELDMLEGRYQSAYDGFLRALSSYATLNHPGTLSFIEGRLEAAAEKLREQEQKNKGTTTKRGTKAQRPTESAAEVEEDTQEEVVTERAAEAEENMQEEVVMEAAAEAEDYTLESAAETSFEAPAETEETDTPSETTENYHIIPRKDIVWVSEDASIADIERAFEKNKGLPLLVCEDSLDNVLGFLRFDGFSLRRNSKGFDLKSIISRQLLYAPYSKAPEEIEKDVLEKNAQLAVLVDEFGSVDGLFVVAEIFSDEETTPSSFIPPEMIFVQGGSFMMGSNNGGREERPVHNVDVADFYIGKYPVTQALWESVMGENPSHFKGPDLPVEQVSWDDAQVFIKKINTLDPGKEYRLPTEAEWEYAARGGQKSQGFTYAGSNDLNEVGWYEDNSNKQTHPVGQKMPNELGLYDMSGNVWEWCYDGYMNYDNTEDAFNSRVFRGGSWYYDSNSCRVSSRGSLPTMDKVGFLGFRLAAAPYTFPDYPKVF
jgi:formylglycine-generating enzyme required for sulfatase activity